jgi:hypothetical protein
MFFRRENPIDLGFAEKVAASLTTNAESWKREGYCIQFKSCVWKIYVSTGRDYLKIWKLTESGLDDCPLSTQARKTIWRAYRAWRDTTDRRRLVLMLGEMCADLDEQKDAAA